jgi:MSHA biogenesis protein MshG
VPYFAYKGRNARGELIQGVIENSDSGAVADQLLNTGISPVDIRPTDGPANDDGDGFLRRLFADKISIEDMLLFSRQMYTLMKSGVPILRALAGLQESSRNSSFVRLIRDIRNSLDSGRDLSTAMRRHPEAFDSFYISMVRVGEMTGRLQEIFLRLFERIEFEKDMKSRVKEALRYPMFVIVAMIIAVGIVNLFVIPAFAQLYKGFKAELPFLTKLLIATSNFTVQYWPVILVMALAGYFGFRFYVATPVGRYNWDRFKLRIPIAGKIIEKATLARFARSFAMSIKSGVPIVQGLSVVSSVSDNAFIAQRLEQMRDGVERGESVLRTAMTAGIFTPVVIQMVSVGEETGALDQLMDDVADLYEREVEYELKTLSSQIEPILIVFLGALVLILALGVFLPIWDLGRVALGNK